MTIGGERDDRAPLRRFVGERGQQHGFGEFGLADRADGNEFIGHPIAEGDRAGLVEQQRVHVAGGFDRAAGGRDHVEADQPVHAGDADRRQQPADGRRNEADQQRDQHADR